ncbi:MAG: type II secretion system protein [Gammaproteobacteria bacterium]
MVTLLKTNRPRGFTLLEVIVSLAITGFILGSLFTLVGGSKQLSWRSADSLVEATRLRAITNYALLQNEYNEVEPILEDNTFAIEALDILEEPERKTQPSTFTLQDFEIYNLDTDNVITGSRWVELALPQ